MKTVHTQHTHTGFTLIETLVAIFIFSSALIALSGIASRGVASVNRAKEVVTAEYLAQEGLELVRAIRDNTTLANAAPWDAAFAGNNPDCTDVCDISYANSSVPYLKECNTTCPPLTIVNGIYSSDTPPGSTSANVVVPTNFVRSITVRDIASNDVGDPVQYVVISRVEWPVGLGRRAVEMTTVLTDWQTPLVY